MIEESRAFEVRSMSNVEKFEKAHYSFLLQEIEFCKAQIAHDPNNNYWPAALKNAEYRLDKWVKALPHVLKVA